METESFSLDDKIRHHFCDIDLSAEMPVWG